MLLRLILPLYIFIHFPRAHTLVAQNHRRRHRPLCHSCHESDLLEDSSDIDSFSRLSSIKACNIAGLGPSIEVTFSGGARLVAVTGGESPTRPRSIHRPTHPLTHPPIHSFRKRHWKIITCVESLGFGDWGKILIIDSFLIEACCGRTKRHHS